MPEVSRTVTTAELLAINTPVQRFPIAQPCQFSGHYFSAACSALAPTTVAGAANRLELYPCWFDRAVTIDRIGAVVTTIVASAQGRIAIYNSDANGLPASQFYYASSSLDFGASSGLKEHVAPLTFAANTLYWMGVHHSSTATLRAHALGSLPQIGHALAGLASGGFMSAFRQAPTFPSPPGTWTPSVSDLVSASPAAVFWRIA